MDDSLQKLIDKANQGDVEAMVNVAECYNHGWFVEKDDRKANEYYRMAAERGHAESEFMLGLAYLDGIGIGKDMSMAVRYIQSSADKGVVNAQYVLGTLYQMDEARQYLKVGKAFDYFEKAAKKGHAKAQIELGDIYIMGDNIEADLSKGVFWLSCAYMQSDSPEENKAAKDRLDRLVRSGMPGGRTRVEQAMEEIRTNYPQYIHISKKRDNACLPERCEDCTHACRTYRDKGNPDKNNREMYCEVYDYHFFPADIEEKECPHYEMRLGCKIKRILGYVLCIYFCLTVIGIVVELF